MTTIFKLLSTNISLNSFCSFYLFIELFIIKNNMYDKYIVNENNFILLLYCVMSNIYILIISHICKCFFNQIH